MKLVHASRRRCCASIIGSRASMKLGHASVIGVRASMNHVHASVKGGRASMNHVHASIRRCCASIMRGRASMKYVSAGNFRRCANVAGARFSALLSRANTGCSCRCSNAKFIRFLAYVQDCRGLLLASAFHDGGMQVECRLVRVFQLVRALYRIFRLRIASRLGLGRSDSHRTSCICSSHRL